MPRRPKKGKSSSLLLRKLIGKLDPVESSILRERIYRICEITKQDMKLNSQKYQNSMIAPQFMETFLDKCLKELSYDNKDSAERNPMNTSTSLTQVESESEVVDTNQEIIVS